MTKINSCKLCKNTGVLQISHAIGDSVFKKIFRNNAGKAISFSDDGNEDVQYSSDSWAEPQLCENCESLLNERYETYSLGVLRGRNAKIAKTSSGITFSGVNLHKLNMYFLSIFWRAVNSGHPNYKNAVMTLADNEYLRDTIYHDKKVPISKFSVKISRLIDLTKTGGFSRDDLKELIVSPFCRGYENKRLRCISVCFAFEGFFIEIFMPGLKLKRRNEPGVIHASRNILLVPYLNIFDIKEIVDLMVAGYGKHIEGRSRVR